MSFSNDFSTHADCIVCILLYSLTRGLCSYGMLVRNRSLNLNDSFRITHDEQSMFCIATDDEHKFMKTIYTCYLRMPTEPMYSDKTLTRQRIKVHLAARGPRLAEEMVRNECAQIRSNPIICWLVPPTIMIHGTHPSWYLYYDMGKVYGYCQKVSRWMSMTDEKLQILEPFQQFSKTRLDNIFMTIVRKECSRWFKVGPDIVNKAVSGFVRQSADEIYIPIELYDELVKFTLPDLIYLKERDLYSGNSNWCPVL
eukprot:786784_1